MSRKVGDESANKTQSGYLDRCNNAHIDFNAV